MVPSISPHDRSAHRAEPQRRSLCILHLIGDLLVQKVYTAYLQSNVYKYYKYEQMEPSDVA